MALLLLSGSLSLLDSSVIAVRAPAPRAPRAHRSAPAKLSADECSMLAVKAAIAKARAEMASIDAHAVSDPAAFGKAMDADRGLSSRVKNTFGNSDLIKSEYTRGRDCVVTVKLPLDRLQALTAGL
jgi:hypothetical protein